MSKITLALLVLASAAISDPPRALEWVGPQVKTLGWRIKTALDVNRLVPKLPQMSNR